GTCLMTQLRDDFWKLCQDPEVENKPLSLLRQQHGIKNFVEFKRHMFEEFRQFARGLPDLQSALVSTETMGGRDGAIDQVISLPGLHIGIIPPDSYAMSGGEAPQNKARSQGTTNAAPPKRSATEASPRPVSTMPLFQGAQEYLERLRALAGLPERNV